MNDYLDEYFEETGVYQFIHKVVMTLFVLGTLAGCVWVISKII